MIEKSKGHKTKQFIFMGTIMAIIMAIIMIGSTVLSHNNEEPKKKIVNLPKIKYENGKVTERDSFKKTYGRDLVLLQQQVEQQRQELKILQEKNKVALEKQPTVKNFLGKPIKQQNSLSINVPPPSKENDSIKPTVVKYSVQNDNIYISNDNDNDNESNITSQNIKSDINNVTNTTANTVTNTTKKKKKDRVKIPAGSFIKGVLLNGIDAPTSSNASGNPYPVAIRFIDKSILPNDFKADIKDCVAIAGGYGELSSERAIIRVDKVSCVKEDGTILESKGNSVGYVTGEDGKVGLEGEVVSKQGAMIARAMASSFFSGISDVLKNANQPSTAIASNGSTVTPSINTGNAMKIGMYSGLSGATSKLSDFYLKLNDQMFPVVEIAVGRSCDIIFNKKLILEEVE